MSKDISFVHVGTLAGLVNFVTLVTPASVVVDPKGLEDTVSRAVTCSVLLSFPVLLDFSEFAQYSLCKQEILHFAQYF